MLSNFNSYPGMAPIDAINLNKRGGIVYSSRGSISAPSAEITKFSKIRLGDYLIKKRVHYGIER